jgi:hypothetical protein
MIEQRAEWRCEYCLLLAGVSYYAHEADHIIAVKHGGKTVADNLAFTCWRCNRRKGSDLGSFDPQTGKFSFLFNPRTQVWSEHFALFPDFSILGLTPEGRTTVSFLQLNNERRIAERRSVEASLQAQE